MLAAYFLDHFFEIFRYYVPQSQHSKPSLTINVKLVIISPNYHILGYKFRFSGQLLLC